VGRPRWFDLRLLTGVLLVLVSVIVGARIVAASDSSEPVWVAARDLAAGTLLTAEDLTRGRVHLYGKAGTYVSAEGAPPTGYVLTRAVGKGELLPVAAVAPVGQAPEFRLVTVQVAPLHVPLHLGAGDRVDVYVTPRTTSGAPQPSTLVFAGAGVQAVNSGGHGLTAGSTDTAVVLKVPPRAVAGVLAGIHGGDVDLVLVPTGQS
jgi:Flp pilus assembly protein CpaB